MYRPFNDGPACIIEVRIDDEWISLVSEILPEHILDRFKQAQAEWYKVLHSDSAKDVKMKILQNATKPSTNLVCGCALSCVGKFPLQEFYEDGNKALTQADWVRYFIEVSSKVDDMPGLAMLSKVCHKWLNKHQKNTKQENREYLPNALAKGSRDFPNSAASAIEDVPADSSHVIVSD